MNNWIGSDDFFFCEWEAEDGQAIPDALEEAGDAAAKKFFSECHHIREVIAFDDKVVDRKGFNTNYS